MKTGLQMLNPTAQSVLICLCRMPPADLQKGVKIAVISVKANVAYRSAKRALKELEEIQWIRRHRDKECGVNAIYSYEVSKEAREKVDEWRYSIV